MMMKKYLTLLLMILSFLLIPSISHATGPCRFYNKTFSSPYFGGTVTNPDTYPYSNEKIFTVINTYQNEVAPFQYARFSISCPKSDLTIDVSNTITDGQSVTWGERLLAALQPTFKATDIIIKVVPRSSGSAITTRIDFFNPSNPVSGDTGSFTYPQPVEVDVIVEGNYHTMISDKVYTSSFYIFKSSSHFFRSNNRTLAYIDLTDPFYGAKNDCVQKGFKTEISPSPVDFGNISQNDLDRGKSFTRAFNLHISRGQSCAERNPGFNVVFIHPESPTTSPVAELNNGLILDIKSNNESIRLGEPVKFDSSASDLDLNFTATISKGAGKTIKAGPFSTTVVYIVEYR